ncbi:MAG: copper chaperone PCu(A)C [Burkholderiales bacterium]
MRHALPAHHRRRRRPALQAMRRSKRGVRPPCNLRQSLKRNADMARRECPKIVIALCAVGFCISAVAADFEVSDAWVRLLPAGAPAGGYFNLRNNSKAPVALVGASSSDYRNVMLHRTKEESGTSRMLHVESVEIPANGSISFAPGSYHLMLMGATRTHVPGDRIPVTLEFSDKHKITAQFEARAASAR